MNRVVITGLGVITPVGNTVDAFWNNLIGGVCGVGPITRFDTEAFKVKIAAEVKDFDPLAYLDKNSARRMDLFTQYAMAAAIQAVEDSGIVGAVDEKRFGVYAGSGIGGMTSFVNETDKLLNQGPRKVSPFFITMLISNIAAGHIAMKYQAKGPTLPVVTACATSTNTIGEAYRAIKHGYADAIIAGGSEATIHPLAVAGFTNCMALTARNDQPGEASIPFDKRRDGFVMGEGAGMLVLEEYEHAKARGATIYAEICGYGNTCDAHHVTAPHPEAEGAAGAITLALEEASYQAGERVYYNAHGTSTPLNDRIETLAVKKAFGAAAEAIHISSTKSMTGHMLGAAGAVEAAAAVLALRDGAIPPTVGYREPDPDCDLNYTPNTSAKAQLDLALSASFGFGGHNAVVALRPCR